MARPAVQALRARWPDAQLVGTARAQHMALIERFDAFDVVVGAPGGAGLARAAEVWAAARRLRSRRLDTAVILAPSFEAALSPWLAGIGRRIGHDTDRRRRLLTDPVAPRPAAHRADEYLDLVRVLDALDPPAAALPLALTAADRAYAARLFDTLAWHRGSRPLFVNPAAAKVPPRLVGREVSGAGGTTVRHGPPGDSARSAAVHRAARPGRRARHGAGPRRDAAGARGAARALRAVCGERQRPGAHRGGGRDSDRHHSRAVVPGTDRTARRRRGTARSGVGVLPLLSLPRALLRRVSLAAVRGRTASLSRRGHGGRGRRRRGAGPWTDAHSSSFALSASSSARRLAISVAMRGRRWM